MCVCIYLNNYSKLLKYVCMLLYVCTSMTVRSCHGIATRLVACCYPQQEKTPKTGGLFTDALPAASAFVAVCRASACRRNLCGWKSIPLCSHRLGTRKPHTSPSCSSKMSPDLDTQPASFLHNKKGARIGRGTSAGKSHCICKAPNPALQLSHPRKVLGPFSTRQGGQDIRSSSGPWDPWNQ